eukprot:COSAG06_NODE_933_length_11441_cov_12.056075_5_plen_312_part_00
MLRRWHKPGALADALLEMPAATRRAARTAANLLTATPDEAALLVACALTDPGDLLHLAAACRRFFIKCIAAPPPPRTTTSVGSAAAAQPTEVWSIIQEAARRWTATCTDQERGWVPRRGRESWLGLMWEVVVLRRRGAVFGRSHESLITLSEGESVATKGVGDYRTRAAASKAVMRVGRHYAQFTVGSGCYMFFGVIRPGWDVEGGHDAQRVDGNCFYYTYNGSRFPAPHGWKGRQGVRRQGDRIGLLVDLDQGTMTVYKNDERLGVMATGLSGEYSWAATLLYAGSGARIDSRNGSVSCYPTLLPSPKRS